MAGYIDIRCPNYEQGCRFDIINQEEYLVHLQECEYILKSCPNGCGKQILSRNLERHLIENCSKRRALCIYCKKELVNDMLRDHQNACDEKMITCKYCGIFGFRKGKIKEHYTSCPKKTHPCTMRFLGCNVELLSEEKEAHESNLKEHFPLIVQKLKQLQCHISERDKALEELKVENQEMRTQMKKAERKIEELRSEIICKGDIIKRSESHESLKNLSSSSSSSQLKNIRIRDNNKWRIYGYEAIKKKAYKGIWSNEMYCTKERGYVFGLRVHISKVVGLFISFYPGEYDEELPWPFPHTLDFLIKYASDI